MSQIPSIQSDFERICQQEWDKTALFQVCKASKRFIAVSVAKGVSTNWIKSVNTIVNNDDDVNVFILSLWVIECRMLI